jgi:hypothetical protein
MKKLFTNLLAFTSIALMMLASCKKDESNKVVANAGKAGTLAANNLAPELTKPTAANAAVTFTWPATPVTGYNAPITYTLQLVKKDSSFSSKSEKEVSLSALTKTFTVGDLNTLLSSMNLSFDNVSQVQVRLKSSAAPNLAATFSNVIILSVKPYAQVGYVYVPGAYQSPESSKQWSPATADSLKSDNNDGKYEGIIGFAAGRLDFKITSKKDWDHTNYGNGGTGKLSTTGGNLSAPSAGLFDINININAGVNTITFRPIYWSIIGDATPGGWGGDTDMAFDADLNTWTVTAPLIGGKQMKFRYDHAWDTNLGGTPAALTNGGANIDVATSGTYKIVLNLNTHTFTSTKL